MPALRVGDRVIAIKDTDKIKKGMRGTVIKCHTTGYTGYTSVEWDDDIDGHNGDNNYGKPGHCWNVYQDVIEHDDITKLSLEERLDVIKQQIYRSMSHET